MSREAIEERIAYLTDLRDRFFDDIELTDGNEFEDACDGYDACCKLLLIFGKARKENKE